MDLIDDENRQSQLWEKGILSPNKNQITYSSQYSVYIASLIEVHANGYIIETFQSYTAV